MRFFKSFRIKNLLKLPIKNAELGLKDKIAGFMDLDRHTFIEKIEDAFEIHPVVALLGPRLKSSFRIY